MSKNVKRLYGQFIPKHYDLKISISEDKKSFTGSVVIDGERKSRPSKRITLHQKNLKIHSATLIAIDKKGTEHEVHITRTVTQTSYDELRLHSGQDLFAGRYRLKLTFSGTITRNMEGIYPCFYKDSDTEKQLIATQFESHHAREVFPCIDEPEAKATFTLELEHAPDEVALGNTPVFKQTTKKDRTNTIFEKTPIMSTYLLAFVVGELAYKETRSSKNNVLIRTYATKDQIEHTAFALDVAARCMDFYEDYYDIPFPLEKCDFVALPDFASGAMENWGLITFREQALLCDPYNTSLSSKQYIAIVVAHELTHQWFGNLVTMRWWTDLWLNEGFASWMEYLAIDHFFPEWDLWTQFAVDEQQLALKLDALEHTHPIEVPIKHPDEIRTIFDAISYQKGASVIHMLHEYLGATGFRDGLRAYLKKHAYGNTHTIDLWQALEETTGKPVQNFMHAWTSQTGFPLVSIHDNNDHYTFTQGKFVANPHSKARNDNTQWPIPLLNGKLSHSTLTKRVQKINADPKHPLLAINRNLNGFYRVHYDTSFHQRQKEAIVRQELSELDRMGLLSDSFEVTKAGYQPVSDYLDLLQVYGAEESLAVWEIIASSLGSIRATLSKNDKDDSLRDAMKPFIITLTQPQLDRLGWEEKASEKHLDTLLRPLILGLSAGAEHPATVKKALELFDAITDAKNPIHPDLRSLVYATVVRTRGEAVFGTLVEMYKNTSSSDEKLSITAALTSFEDVKTHKKMLALIKTDAVRLQDVAYWIAYSFMNRHGRATTWAWLQENWQWLRENLGGDLSFSRMPIYAARSFADKKSLQEYTAFFNEKMEPMLQRSYQQGLEMIETAVAWRTRDAEDALNWFQK
jgi:puromycin-sensitive aminopeptidase